MEISFYNRLRDGEDGDLSPQQAQRRWRWRSLSTIGSEIVEISNLCRLRDSGDGDISP